MDNILTKLKSSEYITRPFILEVIQCIESKDIQIQQLSKSLIEKGMKLQNLDSSSNNTLQIDEEYTAKIAPTLYSIRVEQLQHYGLKENKNEFYHTIHQVQKCDILLKTDEEWAELIASIKSSL